MHTLHANTLGLLLLLKVKNKPLWVPVSYHVESFSVVCCLLC